MHAAGNYKEQMRILQADGENLFAWIIRITMILMNSNVPFVLHGLKAKHDMSHCGVRSHGTNEEDTYFDEEMVEEKHWNKEEGLLWTQHGK